MTEFNSNNLGSQLCLARDCAPAVTRLFVSSCVVLLCPKHSHQCCRLYRDFCYFWQVFNKQQACQRKLRPSRVSILRHLPLFSLLQRQSSIGPLGGDLYHWHATGQFFQITPRSPGRLLTVIKASHNTRCCHYLQRSARLCLYFCCGSTAQTPFNEAVHKQFG